ncbi:aminotransferase class IV [Paraclostridium tenue]|uniref:Aminotransferase class IV n=1 Tax=Paraclostridium tenue TaxID=1737 RepID=A0ABP3X886_9FIRM
MKNKVSFESELSKFGMGLFETIKIEQGVPKYLDMHLDRIFKSVKDLNINIKEKKDNIKIILLEYIKENKIDNKALRLTLFDEGYNISTRDIIYDENMYKKGFKLSVSPIKRGDSILYKHKTTNYFENIYTKKYAVRNGFDDAIFLDTENKILECSMSNIFFIKNRQIYTPDKELPILNGIMKRRIKNLCEELQINMVESDIKINNISDFDFCFVSNSLMGAMKVTHINNIKFDDYNDTFNILWRNLK